MSPFAGEHEHHGVKFEVFEVDHLHGIFSNPTLLGWYYKTSEAKEISDGPFPTAEGAFLAAIGE